MTTTRLPEKVSPIGLAPYRVMEILTPAGTARMELHEVPAPRALLLLGHGAGTGAAGLQAACVAALALGVLCLAPRL